MFALSLAAPLSAGEHRTALTGLTLIDGTGAAPQPDITIVFEGARIVSIERGARELPEGTEVVDLTGKFAVPGLFDIHTHLSTGPASEEAEASVARTLRELLGRGITDVRDMGGDGRVLKDLARRTSAGELPGPDIAYSCIVGGPALFTDRRILASTEGVKAGEVPWAFEVTADKELESALIGIREFGATGVKLYADMDADLVAKVSAAAREQGLKVWSHWVIQPRRSGAMDSVRGNVEVVSHAYMLMYNTPPEDRGSEEKVLASAGGAELFAEMKRRGTILDATLIVAQSLRPPPNYVDPGFCGAYVTRLAHEAGVLVATGSDAPSDGTLPAIHLEYRLLVDEAGFTPLEVIESATRVSSMAVGVEAERGTLEVGKQATLLILDADPATSVVNLAEPRYVIKRGVTYSGANLRDAASAVEPLEFFPTDSAASDER